MGACRSDQEWNGTPFPFYVTPGYSEEDRKTAERSLDEVERFAARVEDQIGYRIVEAAGWIDNVSWSFDVAECPWREPGQITLIMAPEGSLGLCDTALRGACGISRSAPQLAQIWHHRDDSRVVPQLRIPPLPRVQKGHR